MSMKIAREGKQSIIIGKRIFVGQIVGASLAWLFWILEVAYKIEVPAAMVTQAVVLVVGIVQILVVHFWGVTLPDEEI